MTVVYSVFANMTRSPRSRRQVPRSRAGTRRTASRAGNEPALDAGMTRSGRLRAAIGSAGGNSPIPKHRAQPRERCARETAVPGLENDAEIVRGSAGVASARNLQSAQGEMVTSRVDEEEDVLPRLHLGRPVPPEPVDDDDEVPENRGSDDEDDFEVDDSNEDVQVHSRDKPLSQRKSSNRLIYLERVCRGFCPTR